MVQNVKTGLLLMTVRHEYQDHPVFHIENVSL